LSIELIASGIDRIIISLYGLNDDDYLTTTNKHISFDTIYENIKYLNSIKGKCQIFIKVINRVVFTPERKQEFINKFQDHCDFYSIEPILPIWPNFRPEGDDPDLKNVGLYAGVPAVDRLTCHYPFYSMVVNARGFVNPCLADWNESVTLGNAKTDSLCDIWNSKEYNEFRLMQLQGKRRDHLLCSTCGTLRSATCTEDDIDGDRLRLLDKMFPGEGR
jgi:radical SAM protein with 4Fe4S-binding SPASM domain